jgi:hypothetical protein
VVTRIFASRGGNWTWILKGLGENVGPRPGSSARSAFFTPSTRTMIRVVPAPARPAIVPKETSRGRGFVITG